MHASIYAYLLDKIFPKPPFSFCVPPLRHVLEENGSEMRSRGVCYVITQCGSLVYPSVVDFRLRLSAGHLSIQLCVGCLMSDMVAPFGARRYTVVGGTLATQ